LGAEEYDLEWVFVNNYGVDLQTPLSPSAITYNDNLFRFNSTRVSTKNTFYKIPYLYEQGYILYRVRGVGRNNLDNYSSLISGKWSNEGFPAVPVDVASFPNKFPNPSLSQLCNSAEVLVTHEQALNWQSSVSYAEDGKSKAVVSYMDGSLHGRQSVTKIKTDDEVIVGETIYDHEGRPAINVLPVPAGSNKMDYKHNFNQNMSGTPYVKTNFDLDNSSCSTVTPPMSDVSNGASKYYSPNTNAANEDKVVPVANGYPFTQVEYTPDNTGRIKAQSGVGNTHQLNTGKETKYIYGTPFQESLDGLFGSEAGNADRYKQNIVIDANGQASISYIAPDGKVVATSLAGNTPQNLDPLSSQMGATEVKIDLMNKVLSTDNSGLNNDIDFNAGTLLVKETFPVPAEGHYMFKYEVEPPVFDSSCSTTLANIVLSGTPPVIQNTPVTVNSQFCYNCIYDLSISLKDECGNELATTLMADGTPPGNTAVIGNQNHLIQPTTAQGYGTDNCNIAQTNFTSGTGVNDWVNFNNPSPQATSTVNLTPGNYALTKSLKLNESVLEQYTNDYINGNNNCLLKLEDFYAQTLAEADFSGCNITCAQCVDEINAKYTGANCSPCLSGNDLQVLLDECNELCNFKSIKCESAYQIMLADVSPGGQYGQYSTGGGVVNGLPVPTSGNFTPWMFPLSVLNSYNHLPRKSAHQLTFTSPTNHAFITNIGATPTWVPNWRNPYNSTASTDAQKFAYLDSDGNVDYITVVEISTGVYSPAVHGANLNKVITLPDGTKAVEPRYLNNAEDFKNAWKSSWAKSLVYLHPEYCLYERCISDQLSHDYDSETGLPETLAEVQALPGYTGLQLFDPVGNMPNGNGNIIDPYFAPSTSGGSGGNGNSQLANIRLAMEQYALVPGSMTPTYYSIWDVVWMIKNCPNGSSNIVSCPSCNVPPNLNLSTNDDWQIFRGLYLGLKQSFQDRLNMEYAIESGCYNGCIGTDNFNPYNYGFYAYVQPAPFNFWTAWSTNNFNWPSTTNTSQYFNSEQPCSVGTKNLYKAKKPVFAVTNQLLANVSSQFAETPCYDENGEIIPCPPTDAATLDAMQNQSELTNYQNCKQCPVVVNIQNLLSGLATIKTDASQTNMDLTTNNIPLSCYPSPGHAHGEFIPELQLELGFAANEIVKWNHDATVSTMTYNNVVRNYLRGTLEGSVGLGTPTVRCSLELLFPSYIIDQVGALPSQLNPVPFSNVYTFSDVTDICCLSYFPSPEFGNMVDNFKCQATVLVKLGDPIYIPGTIQYRNVELLGQLRKLNPAPLLNLRDCTFEPVCTTSEVGYDLQNLMNGLLFKNPTLTAPVTADFFNSNVDLDVLPYSELITSNLSNALGNSSSYTWTGVAAGNMFSGTINNGAQNFTVSLTIVDNTVSASNIVKLFSLKPVPGGLNGDFTALALIRTPALVLGNPDVLTYKKVTGNISNDILVGSCSTATEQIGTTSQLNVYDESNMCEARPNPRSPGFVDFLLNPANIALFQSSNPHKYYKDHGDYTLVKVGDECRLNLTFPPNLNGYIASQIVSVHAVYGDPTYLQVPGSFTNHILMSVEMTDGNTIMISGEAPCEQIFGCNKVVTECSSPVEVLKNGNFNLGNQDFIFTNPSESVGNNGTSDHTTCGDDIILNCTTGNYLIMFVSNSSNLQTVWQQSVLLSPNTDYNFSLYHTTGSASLANVTFELLLDGNVIQTSGLIQSNGFVWMNTNLRFNTGALSYGSNGFNEIALRVIAGPESRFLIDDVSLTYCGSPNSFICNMPPPSENIEVPDDCIENMLNNAMEGAQNEYEEYIAEQRILFQQAYKRHCLDVYEKFELKYPDTEHHYTLYYYDQAGNLERTVPPNGVVKVPESKWDQVALDRQNGTHTVFTDHTYTTTYKYNSLNQLVSQSMPDHQDMNISGSQNYTGINPTHNVQAITFNGSNGLAVANDGTNGYVYSYNSTNHTWQQLTGLTINNLNDVIYIDATTAYAIGDKGTVLYTNNTGTTWNLLPFPNVSKDLIRLHKTSATGVDVCVYDAAGNKWTSANNGLTWTNNGAVFTLNTNELVVDIDVNDASGEAWALSNTGRYFKTSNVYITPWSAISSANKSVDLTSVATNGTNYYVFGKDGTVLRTDANLQNWLELESKATDASLTPVSNPEFKQVVFTTATNALALAADGKVFETADGAQNWAISNPGSNETVVQLNHHLTSNRIYALTSAGNVYYYAGSNWSPSSILSSPLPTAGTSLFMTSINMGYIGDNTGNLYSITTNTASVTSAALTFTTTNQFAAGIKEMHFNNFSDGYILTNATSNQNVYHFEIVSSAPSAAVAGTTTDIYTELAASTGGAVYLTDANGKIASVNGTTINTSLTISGASNIANLAFGENGTDKKAIVVGAAGQIYAFSGASEFTLQVPGTTLQLPTLTSITSIDASTAIVVGNDGTVVKTTDGGTYWNTLLTDDNTNLKDVAANATNMVAAGNTSINAMANNFVYGAISASTLSKITNNTNKDITKVVVDANSMAYLVGDNYAVSSLNINSQTTSLTTTTGNGNLLGADVNGNDLLLVGEAGIIYNGGFNSLALQSTFIPPVLNDIKYLDNTHAIGVGNGGSIITTANAGLTWQALPIVGGNGENLNALTITDNTHAYAVGNAGTFVEMDFTNGAYHALNINGSGLTGDINDIDFSNNYFIAVSSNGNIYEKENTNAAFNTYFTTASALTALTNKNGYFGCAVGNNGVIVRGTRTFGNNQHFTWTASTNNNTTWSAFLTNGPSLNQNDIYFVDYNTGYVVGENGLLMKTVNGALSFTLESYSNIPSGTGTNTLNTVAVAPAGSSSTFVAAGNAGISVSVADMKNDFSTKMYYDKLGRLIASQNARQFAKNPLTFSYTIYDGLGRISEVGEYLAPSSIEQLPNTVNGQVNLQQFANWIGVGTANKTEVTKTFYDDVASISIPGFTQDNLRNRVSYTIYLDKLDRSNYTNAYEHASYFNYDIHGNVKNMIQHNPYMPSGNEYKTLDYDYDLISGKVNEVVYQKGYKDQLYHKYEYDADNRITNVYTSTDGTIWDQDAKYFYYKHGPLARTEIGDLKVQGVDYAYTIHGWIKGVNSNSLDANNDIGVDGEIAASNNLNKNLARDKFGYSLGYYAGDYAPKGNNVSFIANQGALAANNFDLFNGNISNMTTTITEQNGAASPMLTMYKYDQLNRIKLANKYVGLSNNSWTTATASNAYFESFNYDANGNILSLSRKDNVGNALDILTYNYETVANGYGKNTNKLGGVDEAAGITAVVDDIEDQDFSSTNHALNNYQYDEIGNLIKDKKEKIANIEWTVYGKIKSITRIAGTTDKDNLRFEYDASGNRVAKHVSDVASGNLKYSTYYVRDAQGNVMCVYDVNPAKHDNSTHLFLTEQHLYGSSRLGMKKANVDMGGSLLASNGEYTRTLGQKSYEFSNHLGNILSVMTDNKLPVDVGADGTIDYYSAEVISASDYYAFGSKLALRGHTPNEYAYSFNGKRDDEETGTQDYGFRIYNPSIGKFLSVDPLKDQYPELTPYQFASNSPIQAVDLDGREIYHYTLLNDNNGKPYLKLLSIQYNEMSTWQELNPFFNYASVHNTSKYSGEKINYKKIIVARGEGQAAEYYGVTTFKYFKELLEWKDQGFPESDEEKKGRADAWEGVVAVTSYGLAMAHSEASSYDSKYGNTSSSKVWRTKQDNNYTGALANRLGKNVKKVDYGYEFNGQFGDIDIVTTKYYIEVKSGGNKMKLTQSLKNMAYANSKGYNYILYMPNATTNQVKAAAEKGITVIRSESILKKQVEN